MMRVRAIGYLRVSTAEQVASGLGLAEQRSQLVAEAARRGWELDLVVDDGCSAKDLRRPGITAALDDLAAGRADVLVVAKLDRLSRSLLDFAGLMARAQTEGWSLVALDLGVDLSTPAGQLMASVLASFAEYERQLIGARTRDALGQLKARGVRLGGPRVLDSGVEARIVAERATGRSLTAIAAGLDADGVPTARGGARWYPSTVRAVLRSVELDEAAAAASSTVAA